MAANLAKRVQRLAAKRAASPRRSPGLRVIHEAMIGFYEADLAALSAEREHTPNAPAPWTEDTLARCRDDLIGDPAVDDVNALSPEGVIRTWIRIIRQRHADGVYPDNSNGPVLCDEALIRKLRFFAQQRARTNS